MKNLQDILKNWWESTGSGMRPELTKTGTFEDHEEFVYRILESYNEHLKNNNADMFTEYLDDIEGDFTFDKLKLDDYGLTMFVNIEHEGEIYPRIWIFDEKETQKIVDCLKEKL
jgi:hypothetical protein